jgi:hypothetical protein
MCVALWNVSRTPFGAHSASHSTLGVLVGSVREDRYVECQLVEGSAAAS